jgi:trehalose 2-sulfotransferase
MNPGLLAARHVAWSRSRRRAVTQPRRAVPPTWTAPAVTYLICTSPRSGSWLLCDALRETGLAGRPREWFNRLEQQQQRGRWRLHTDRDLPLAGYLTFARELSTTSNGVSGGKLHFYQFASLPWQLGWMHGFGGLTPAGAVSRLFPGARFIWLTRQDKARQAISLYLAARSGQWWQLDERPREEQPAVRFDAAAIARIERELTVGDEGWRDYFTASGVDPLVIRYEDFAGSYAGTVRNVLGWLGIADAENVTIAKPRLRRQADARTEEWLGEYLAAKAAGGAAVTEDPDAVQEPPFGPRPGPVTVISPVWRQWVARQILRAVPASEITDVLVRNDFSRDAAAAEVDTAMRHPYLRGAGLAQRELAGRLLAEFQSRRPASLPSFLSRFLSGFLSGFLLSGVMCDVRRGLPAAVRPVDPGQL